MESVKEEVSVIKEELPDGQTTLCGAGDISDTNVFSEFVSKKQIPIIKEELPDKRTMFGGGDVLNSKVFSKINKTLSKMESVKEQVPIIKEELPEGQTSLCGAGDILDTNVFSEFVSKKQNQIIKEELPDKRTMFGGGDIRILKVFSKNTHLEANAARSEKESSCNSSAQALCEIRGKKFISAEAARVHVTVYTGHMSVLPNPAEKSERAIKQSEAVDKQSEAKKQSGEADEQSGRAEKQSRGADKKRDKPDKQSGETEIASQSHVPGGTMDTESSDDDEESTLTHLPKSTPSSSESAVNPAKKLDRGRPLTRSPISYRQRNKRKCPVCYREYGTHLARHFERNHPDINPNMYRHRRGDGNPGRERMVGCKICRKNLNLSSFPRHFRRVHKDIEATVRSPKYKSSMGPAIYSHIDQLNRFLDRHIACRKLSSTAAERERKYVIDFLSQNDRKSPEEMVASLREGISASCAHAKISAIILFLKFMKSVSDEPGADVIITKQRNSYMHHLLKTFSPVVSREKIRDATAQLMRDKDKMNKNYSAVKRMANGRQHCNFLQKDINDENYNDCLAALVVDTILVTGTRPMFFYSLSSEEIQKPLCKPTDSDNNYVLQFKKNKQRSGIGYFVLKTQQKERLDELAAFSNPAFKNKKVAILTLNGKPLNSSTMAKYVKRYLKRYEVHLTLQLLRKLANTMAALLPEEMKECVSMAGDHPKSVAMRYYQTLERRHRARKGGEILDMIWKNNLKREGNDLEMDMRRAGKIFECILEETKLPEPEKREYDEKNFEEKSIEAQQEVSSDEEGSIEKMKCKEKVDLNARTQEMEKEKGKKRTKDEDEDSPTLAQWLDLAPKSKKQKSGRKSSKAMAGDKKGGRDFVMKNFLSEIPSTSAQPPTPLATESTRNRKRKNGCPEKSGAEKTMAFKLPRISGGPNSFTQNLLVAFIYDDRLKGYLFENETLPSAKVSTLAMELDVECVGLVSKLKWAKKSLQTLF